MKIIDLLVKISHGEDVPKEIKYNGAYYHYEDGNYIWQVDEETEVNLLKDCELNDEVEIIEEKKLPEKIDLSGYWDKNSLRTEEWCSSEELIVVKINEILDYLESKEKGDE